MTGMDLTFRTAEPTDVPAIVALVTSAYRGDDSRQGWTTEADLLEGQRVDDAAVLDDIAKPGSIIVLGEADGEIVACVHLDHEEAAGYFGMFAVHPKMQGSGLGKVMMAEAERIVRDDWGLPTLRMTVIDVRDTLLAFYERRGFVRTGETEPFPYGDPRFGIPQRDDLRFAVLVKDLTTPATAKGLDS